MISSTPSPSAACLLEERRALAARNNCLFAGIYLKSVNDRESKRVNARVRKEGRKKERPLGLYTDHYLLFVFLLLTLGMCVCVTFHVYVLYKLVLELHNYAC